MDIIYNAGIRGIDDDKYPIIIESIDSIDTFKILLLILYNNEFYDFVKDCETPGEFRSQCLIEFNKYIQDEISISWREAFSYIKSKQIKENE